MTFREFIRELAPPVVVRVGRSLLGRPHRHTYQGVQTLANMSALHHGRFAAVYDSVCEDDPDLRSDGNRVRLRAYYAYLFASIASTWPGDFVSVGVSYGVTERVLFELIVKGGDRVLHLVDSFEDNERAGYCRNPATVMAHFHGDPLVRLHRVKAPAAFPLPLDRGLAFAVLGTGDEAAEIASLPYLARCLGAGGIIVIEDYGWNVSTAAFDAAAQRAGGSIFTLTTGQGVFVKA
jgi:hypothetical protein